MARSEVGTASSYTGNTNATLPADSTVMAKFVSWEYKIKDRQKKIYVEYNTLW